MSASVTEDQLKVAIEKVEKKFNEKLDELQKILIVTQRLQVGSVNDPTKQVIIEDGKVDGRDVLVTSNENNNKQSIKEHIENPNAHKSLPITGGNLKFIDDPNPHVIEQDPEKDGYIGLSKDKIKDANGDPKESLVINGVTSESDTIKERRIFLDSDSIVTNGEIKANNIRISQSTATIDGIANIGFMKTTEPFLFIEGAKGSDGLNRTQIDSHIAVTNAIICDKEIRSRGTDGIRATVGNIMATVGNITATGAAPGGTVNGREGNFRILKVNNNNIETELSNLEEGLRKEIKDLRKEIKDLKDEYKNHNHQFKHVILSREKIGEIVSGGHGGSHSVYHTTWTYPSPLIDEESKRDDTTKPKQVG